LTLGLSVILNKFVGFFFSTICRHCLFRNKYVDIFCCCWLGWCCSWLGV